MGKFIELTGKQFGEWLVLRRDEKNDKKHIRWLCRCSCGKVVSVMGTHLKSGASTSCGCKRNKTFSEKKTKDLRGNHFGKLTALSNTRKMTNNGFIWECVCDCGANEFIDVYSLTSGKIVECSECRKHGFNSVKSYGCYFRNQEIIKKNKSLLEIIKEKYPNIDIMDYWDISNKLKPEELTEKSHQDIFIICPVCREKYKTSALSLYSRTYDLMCPECLLKEKSSCLEKEVNNYLENVCGFTVNHEYNCNIIPVNPKTKRKLPFDNEIIDKNAIIEVHGKQHYEEITHSKWLNGKTPSEWLKELQERDEYKKQVAISHGYKYLALSYKQILSGEYKGIINNFIKEG